MKKYILDSLKSCFSYDTCHNSYKSKWSIHNPTAGHCAVASLIIKENFGGKIFKIKVGNNTHYFNVLENGNILDITSEQFNGEINYNNKIEVNDKQMLKNKDTYSRYMLLKNRFTSKITQVA